MKFDVQLLYYIFGFLYRFGVAVHTAILPFIPQKNCSRTHDAVGDNAVDLIQNGNYNHL
jgi:hypothetical protein